MSIFLFLLAVLFFIVGSFSWLMAATSIHQIGASVALLIGAIFLSGAGIIEAINKMKDDVIKVLKINKS